MSVIASRGRLAAQFLVAAAFISGGCAALGLTPVVELERRLDSSAQRLAEGHAAAAYDDLLDLALTYPEEELGQRALLLLMAAELDPRNPHRRLWAASDLGARYLQNNAAAAWSVPLAETLYLLAQELGAAEERARQAEAIAQEAERRAQQAEAGRARAEARARAAQAAPPRSLPQFQGPTVPARVGAVTSERDELASRVRTLEAQLAAQRQELERIRQTLRP
jgi:hypothetical protein